MNIKKILFPTDYSESSKAAFGYASALASETGAELLIAHAFDDTPAYLSGYAGMVAVPDYSVEIERENRLRLQQIVPTPSKVKYEHRFLKGSPGAMIVDLANSEEVDLIVMGTHGRTGVSRLLMGSIAEEVLRHAECPVLTVKHPMQDEPASEASTEQNAERKEPTIKSKLSLH